MQRVVTRFVVAAIILAGLAAAPSLERDAFDEQRVIEILPLEQPRFEIFWWRGELRLSGHTVSTRHEKDLLAVATTVFTAAPVVAEFEPLGIVPDYWEAVTVQVLYALAHTASAQARLAPDDLTVRAVAVDDSGWQTRFEALIASLPTTFDVSDDTILVNTHIDRAKICERAFKTFAAGRINFEESSSTFRSSAYPRLARVTALANACQSSTITITGHSDNTGTETWNLQLSSKRANAVADYLVSGGIDRTRLRIVAAGSSQPVASNDTHYGRSLNRRIEIDLDVTVQPRSD